MKNISINDILVERKDYAYEYYQLKHTKVIELTLVHVYTDICYLNM